MALRALSELGEPPSRWIDRIKSWQAVWNSENRQMERRRYRDALRGKWPMLVPWAMNEQGISPLRGGDQVALNLLGRFERRVKAMAFDESPEIRFPRDRKGSERFAEGVDRLMSRETERAGLPFLYRQGVTLLCTDGAFAIYSGVEEVYTREAMEGLPKDEGQVITEAAQGTFQPTSGRDHVADSGNILKVATEDANLLANPPEVTTNMVVAADASAKAAAKEEKAPQKNLDKGRYYGQLLVYGTDFARDPTALSPWLGRWMARRILLSEEEKDTTPLLDDAVRKMLQVRVPGDGSSTKEVSELRGDVGEDARRVELWEVWDLWSRERHIVADGCEYYCEASSAYPYLKVGKPGLRRFFPFTLCEPNVGAGETVKDTLPIPLFRDGWAKQCEYIKIDSHICMATKRACVDKYVAHALLTKEDADALTDGMPGAYIKGRAEIPDPSKSMVALNFTPPLQEAIQERGRILYDFAIAMNFPLSELTSQPVADTVGQEEIALSGGNAGTADIIKVLQSTYADTVEVGWSLVQLGYPEELISEQAGMQFVQAALDSGQSAQGLPPIPLEMLGDEELNQALKVFVDMVRSSPLSGERPAVRFGATSKDQDPVRVKQNMEFGTWLITTLGPLALPAFIQIAQEAARSLGHGDLPSLGQVTPEAFMQQQAEQAAAQNPQDGSGGQNGKAGKTERGDQESGAPDRESVRKGAKQIQPAM